METLYEIEFEIVGGEPMYRLTILETGEIREARDLVAILRTLVREHGFYLRPVK